MMHPYFFGVTANLAFMTIALNHSFSDTFAESLIPIINYVASFLFFMVFVIIGERLFAKFLKTGFAIPLTYFFTAAKLGAKTVLHRLTSKFSIISNHVTNFNTKED